MIASLIVCMCHICDIHDLPRCPFFIDLFAPSSLPWDTHFAIFYFLGPRGFLSTCVVNASQRIAYFLAPLFQIQKSARNEGLKRLRFVYTSSSRCHIDSSILQGNPVIVTALHQKALAYIRSRIEDCHGDVELFVACSWEKLRAGHGHAGSVLHRWQIHFRLILPDSVGTAFNGLHRSNWHRTSDIGSRAGGLSGRVSQLHIAGTLVARCWCCFAANVGCFSFD